MSITIYLDDCSDHDDLSTFLTQAGHTVITPRAAGTKGWDDPDHLEYAADHGYVLLTHNPRHFSMLHQSWQPQDRTHGGIFFIYRDNNVRKDMMYDVKRDA